MNYKRPINNQITIGGKTHIIKPNETLKVLHLASINRTTTLETFHDTEAGNANYQVPAGKTFKIIGALQRSPSTGTQFIIISGATAADSNTGEVEAIKYVNVWLWNSDEEIALPSKEIASSLYVGQKSGGTHTTTMILILYGVEY